MLPLSHFIESERQYNTRCSLSALSPDHPYFSPPIVVHLIDPGFNISLGISLSRKQVEYGIFLLQISISDINVELIYPLHSSSRVFVFSHVIHLVVTGPKTDSDENLP